MNVVWRSNYAQAVSDSAIVLPFTRVMVHVLRRASDAAAASGRPYTTADDLASALLATAGTCLDRISARGLIELDTLGHELRATDSDEQPTEAMTAQFKAALAGALQQAAARGGHTVRTEDLLLALLARPSNPFARAHASGTLLPATVTECLHTTEEQ